ncbi:orotidine-5'-phosphate decarboxylase [Sporosarcina ureilytica]|uniref:Orotidine 5'-phosphate decarboxylase n=1 Tax=Sporosarcina ureilytica TaxID=298596 RepID=A0A1D8JHY0_9BACL|nr:orotidine-5'-phosphate decarboxylase [Sporosarcina ureilytica]AOV08319.1 orotidine 5'-phosphate decarboxylase [Sporosarcina ureilytica]
MNQSPIIALDFHSAKEAFTFLEPFEGKVNVKVGMQLFYKEGPAIVERLKGLGHSVFLDLKLHDIPNTVKLAMEVLASHGADLVNVHAAGGQAMMEAALEGLDKGTPVGLKRPSIIAVTQLTSTDEEQMRREQLINASLEQSVLHFAQLTKKSGLDGVVCSVHEASAIAEVCGKDFLKVTPGIRLADSHADDQKRIATPNTARLAGSTHIVVGRAITKASHPRIAYENIRTEWEGLSKDE